MRRRNGSCSWRLDAKPRRRPDTMDNPGLVRKDGIEAREYASINALKRRLLGPAALQKLLAFASLVLLLVYFSFASPAFMQTDNMINILQATAVNGVLAIASTFVIITAGIDLSVGTLMAKMKVPPFIATLGMMQVLKGLSLVVSGDKPIYFSNTENFSVISQDSLLGYVLPGLPIPN